MNHLKSMMMKYNSNFKYDLEIGNVHEKMLGDLLEGKKLEVKTDFMAMKTGNIYVEFESRGKASGISTSEASHYAWILVDGPIVIIEKDKLKSMCRIYLGTSREKLGGDNNTSKGILLPLTDLLLL